MWPKNDQNTQSMHLRPQMAKDGQNRKKGQRRHNVAESSQKRPDLAKISGHTQSRGTVAPWDPNRPPPHRGCAPAMGDTYSVRHPPSPRVVALPLFYCPVFIYIFPAGIQCSPPVHVPSCVQRHHHHHPLGDLHRHTQKRHFFSIKATSTVCCRL